MSNAQALLAQAAKKESSSGGFSSFFGGGGSSKFEEARDLYLSASNAFKLDKKYKESGDAAAKAGECALKASQPDDAANDFWNASKSYKRTHPELAVAALRRTIALLTEKGRFRQAADREKEVAQIYKIDGSDLQAALRSFEQAGEWYSTEDATATANACFKDAADIAAQLGQYDKAIQRFEQVAAGSLESQLTRYSTKEYFLKAGLCHLCEADPVSFKRAVDTYCQQDNTFSTTRECKFLLSLSEAIEAGDIEGFTQHVYEYDHLTRLDEWKTAILLKIKNTIAEEPSLT